MNKQITTQTRLGFTKPGSSFSKIEKNQSSKIDHSIIDAFNKFSALSNQYQVQFDSCNLFSNEDNSKFLSKRKGKVDNFAIMAQLRHLQNMASLSNAQHEKVQRENRRHKVNHFYRKKRNWKKIENNLNTPYLTLYNNWAKQKQQQQEFFMKNLRDSEQSQQDKSLNQEELSQKIFNFTKELKPYKKIVQFTKSKMKIKQEFKCRSPIAKRKAQSLDQLESAPKNKGFQEYNQISRKYVERKDRQKMKSEGIVPTEKIIQKNISRIFKKSNTNSNAQELMNHERFQNLVRKQSEIIENSQHLRHRNDSYKQVKGKFAQIICEMSKSMINKKMGRKVSDSLDLKKKGLRLQSKASKYSTE